MLLVTTRLPCPRGPSDGPDSRIPVAGPFRSSNVHLATRHTAAHGRAEERCVDTVSLPIMGEYVVSAYVRVRWLLLSLIPLLTVASQVMAHHSFAGFDMDNTMTLSGTLVRFDFSAPHARVVVLYTSPNGEPQEYQFMTGAPTQLLQSGLDPRTLHKGDKIQITYHPTRNGSLGGQVIKMVLPDGREFGNPSLSADGAPPPDATATPAPAVPQTSR